MIRFTVYGEPAAQGRPRFTTVNGHARAYDPAKSREYKDYVRLVATQHKPQEPLTGALTLNVIVYRSIPKGFSNKKAQAAEKGEIRPITKPDADNYLKGVKDALKSVIWRDDSQIVGAHVTKWYSSEPRIVVEVFPFGAMPE